MKAAVIDRYGGNDVVELRRGNGVRT